MSDAPKIKIEVPEVYRQVDNSVWEELEIYLFRSFLTSPAIIADQHFVFKTLNHHEIANINFHKPIRGTSEEVQKRYRSTLIAYSVFMIDGENVLHQRAEYLRKLINVFGKMDNAALEVIVQNLSHLNKRATFLFPLTESYVHENRSRFKWYHIKQTSINSPIVTGITGTDILGMNYCQQMWTTLNHLQDIKEEMERDWSNSKFIGSCFNSKGVRPIEEKDRGRREKERQDQEDLKMKVLYRYLNRNEKGESVEPKDVMTLPDGRKVIVESRSIAESVDELAEQLSSSLSGEKDAHDEIIEKALKKMQEKRDQADKERVNIYQIAAIDNDEHSSSVLPGGKQEANNRLMRMRLLQQEQARRVMTSFNPDKDDGSSIEE